MCLTLLLINDLVLGFCLHSVCLPQSRRLPVKKGKDLCQDRTLVLHTAAEILEITNYVEECILHVSGREILYLQVVM